MASCGRVMSHLPSSLTVLSSVYLTLFKLNLSRGCQTHDYVPETYRMFASVRGGRRMDFASTIGRRAHQRCSVEMLPWCKLFSCEASALISRMGIRSSVKRRSLLGMGGDVLY